MILCTKWGFQETLRVPDCIGGVYGISRCARIILRLSVFNANGYDLDACSSGSCLEQTQGNTLLTVWRLLWGKGGDLRTEGFTSADPR